MILLQASCRSSSSPSTASVWASNSTRSGKVNTWRRSPCFSNINKKYKDNSFPPPDSHQLFSLDSVKTGLVLSDVEAAKVEGELHGEVGEGDDAQPEDEEEGLQETPGTVEHSHWPRFINILSSDWLTSRCFYTCSLIL